MKKLTALLLISIISLSINGQIFSEQSVPTGYVSNKGTLNMETAKYEIKSLITEGIAISFEIIKSKTHELEILKLGYYQNNEVFYREYAITEKNVTKERVIVIARSYLDDFVRIEYNKDGFILNYNLDEEYFDSGVWKNYYFGIFASNQ